MKTRLILDFFCFVSEEAVFANVIETKMFIWISETI